MADVYAELNEVNRLLCIAIEALTELTKPSGAYSEDRLKHAENTIENVSQIAKGALALIDTKETKDREE